MIVEIIVFLLLCGLVGSICDLIDSSVPAVRGNGRPRYSSPPVWSDETLRKSEALKERMAAKDYPMEFNPGNGSWEPKDDPKGWAAAR